MSELLVDGADQLHRDHVELIRKERPLSGLRIHGVEKVRDPGEVLPGRQRSILRREHVAVERVAKPDEQPFGGGGVAEYVREGALAVPGPEPLLRDDATVAQVLGEDRPADQALGGGTVQPRRHEVALQRGEIAEELSVDAGSAIDLTRLLLLPETPRFHGQPARERVELLQCALNGSERPQQVCPRVSPPPVAG